MKVIAAPEMFSNQNPCFDPKSVEESHPDYGNSTCWTSIRIISELQLSAALSALCFLLFAGYC